MLVVILSVIMRVLMLADDGFDALIGRGTL